MSDSVSQVTPEVPPRSIRQRATIPLIIVAAIFIIVPFFTWYGTWFGRSLTDEKISEYLADEKNPRHVQHALAQIAERLEKNDANVRRWYPQIIALANSNLVELRSNVAWVMGKDNQSTEFHETLKRLAADKDPLVQRNAAVALVAFNDSSGRDILRSMLQPYRLTVANDGELKSVLKEGVSVKVGMMLARMSVGENQLLEVRSPLPGEIQQVVAQAGTTLKAGDTLLFLSPDSGTVWEALRALYFVGQRDDLALVEPYVNGVSKMPGEVKQQAALTAKAIQTRAANSQK